LFASARLSKRAILYGPSGNGKTLLLRALANEMGMNVLSVKVALLGFFAYIGQFRVLNCTQNTLAKVSKKCAIYFPSKKITY
jgi:SpoVK/Ycf46/Vps4 family AAA+-type ATPase